MTNKRNDNGMSREEAGKKGGDQTSKNHGKEFYEDIGQKGGKNSGGNFANDPERASQAGKKGGENSHSGGGNHR
ncbi:general stress protein [Halomonas sp. DWK9]|uniref:general stress protein n=1 Tax=Halomonas sp. DWK9 TaxID=3060155 RepID=UPI00287F5E0B|nr:general stress protein [Halomonas sp. DWK9]